MLFRSASFVEDAGKKPDHAYALKRIDTSGIFEPSNVRWAIKTQNSTSHALKAEAQRRFRKANPDYVKNSELRKKYGITLDDYNRMLDAQKGVCAICGNPETRIDKHVDKVSSLAVDH